MSSNSRQTGPLTGLRVVELASETAAYAGKLLADFGAEVLLIEPPGGHRTRTFAPFAEEIDSAEPAERSLWFWHYNTSKLGVEIDLDTNAGAEQFRQLVAHADIVLEAETPGYLTARGIDYEQLRAQSKLVWVSVSAFGRHDPRSLEPSTNLTVVAGGGIAWSCGYDDHSLPPMACRGNQGYQTAAVWAGIGALAAIAARSRTGLGQFVDVSMHAAANVTTEQATQWWLVAGKNVERQTGRHASHIPTDPTIVPSANGHESHTGFPPRTKRELEALINWVNDLGLREKIPLMPLLDIVLEQGGFDLTKLAEDEFMQECYRTAREALVVIAAHLSDREFFVEGQTRGFAVGMILSPDEVMVDEHLVARNYPAHVFQPQLGRTTIHPGLPINFVSTPGATTAAPGVGEHQYRLTDLLDGQVV